MSRQERKWHPNFVEYMKFIVNHPNYKGMPEAHKEDGSRVVNLCLSELRKAGWLTSEQNPKDPRTKLYKLEDMNKVHKEIIKELRQNG